MDQSSEFWKTAKQILNHKNPTPYSDQEIKEIIKLLESISDVICYNITHKKVNANFPLKDFVLCPKCGNPLLASTSKGR